MINFFTPTIAIELSCFIVAAICLYNDKNMIWRGMMVFLLFTCLTEIIGMAAAKNIFGIGHGNNWVYNIYVVLEATFTGSMYVYLTNRYIKQKRTHTVIFALLACLYIAELFKNGSFYRFNDISTTVMSVLFIGYGLYYFYLLIKDTGYEQLSKHPPFWWVAGNLFFYYGSSVLSLYYAIFNLQNQHYFKHRNDIYLCLNIILYGCWIYSFICRYHQRKLIHS